MMYAYGWLTLVMLSLWVSLIALIWAIKSGQFTEQSRARYFPLRDMNAVVPTGDPAKLTVEVYVLAGIFFCAVLIMLVPAAMMLWRSLGG